jgi:hypothetical protein
MDRLAWDLGNPAGELDWQTLNQQGVLVTNSFHPMKGAMLTQTLARHHRARTVSLAGR